MGRFLALVGGLTWLTAMLVAVLLLHRVEHRPTVRPLTTVPVLLQELNAHPARPAPPWSVTRAVSAHHVLVVEVSAARVEDARLIATDIVDKMAARKYDEILVYVWNAAAPARFAERRVQWTRANGYAELAIGN